MSKYDFQAQSYSGNHLSRDISVSPHNQFNSLCEAPLPKFGFPARGVYRVPSIPFPILLRHCGTFQSYSGIAEALAVLLAVTITGSPAYFFTEHEHYKHLSLCEHGLSSTDISQPQSPEIYK